MTHRPPTHDLPPLCRPAGWIALWRRIALTGNLNRRCALSPC